MQGALFTDTDIKPCYGGKGRNRLPNPLPIPLDPTQFKPTEYARITLPQVAAVVMDIECYSNYFLVKFMRVSDGETVGYEMTPIQVLNYQSIRSILDRYEVITFNGNRYDLLMLRLALKGATNAELKDASDRIITDGLTPWAFETRFKLPYLKLNHIDLVELCPGILSLKIYGGRLNCHKMQDLPFDESLELTKEQMDAVNRYCDNDLDLTKRIYLHLQNQINLRRDMSQEYRTDLRSKSDAQIAEEVIRKEIMNLSGKKIRKREVSSGSFVYQVPPFIRFTSPVCKKALEIVTTKPFQITSTGRIEMPEELMTLKVKLGRTTYQMGMGGLHSTESSAYHVSDDLFTLFDWDVASYYPSIILNCNLYPEQLGEDFLNVYRKLVHERLEAKRENNKIKADALKITINGGFGKLGSPYSVLYSPDLFVQVTVTGQLALLMLIEMMEVYGILVVSGNTDGIVLKCPVGKEKLMQEVITRWERRTGFEMECSQYLGLFSRDVNNYIAIKANGSAKCKGIFTPAGLQKNPHNEICSLAMVEYLRSGTPFEQTIRKCRDITKFLTVRSVKGGAVKDGIYLGKAVRWYYAVGESGAIQYKSNGNQVAMTKGAKPLMDLPETFPEDINYEHYINHCYSMF